MSVETQQATALYTKQQRRDAEALIRRVASLTGARLRVYSVNDSQWVAAVSRNAARKWCTANSIEVNDCTSEVSVFTIVGEGVTGKPLWILIAEQYKERIAESETEGVPANLLDPFVIATEEPNELD